MANINYGNGMEINKEILKEVRLLDIDVQCRWVSEEADADSTVSERTKKFGQKQMHAHPEPTSASRKRT